ncbi:MAG TPA: NAD-dependent epimerase/dehydratase family protein [Methanofastidiosum sp.]|nr:NAD-dependent epimerase/dehydratase family protein [Methanofastidiosum sp.]
MFSLKDKNILVTGGAGFIGSHLVDELVKEEPYKIVVVDNLFLGKESNLYEAKTRFNNLKFYKEDASDFQTMKGILEKEKVDIVFNLAVLPLPASLADPKCVFEKNVDIVSTFCELVRKDVFETLIHFSSSEVYGTSEYAPMDEKHPLNGTTPYAASKGAGDLLVSSYWRTFNIDATIIRPFNNYGPRQNEGSYAGVMPLTIKRVLNGESPEIYGDGNQTRDYLYVTDTAKAAIKVYKSKKTRGKVLNIASGREVSIEYIIKFIAKYLDCKSSIMYKPERPGDVRRHIANVFLAEDLIRFKSTVSFDEGLIRTIEWYKQNIKN